jgi:tripartite-type tricarboxylate transporter receptor subunit TctC
MSGIVLRRSLLGAGVALATLGAPAHAQPAWPNQPLRLIVPFAPGGTTDLAARLVADGMARKLGQGVVVENRAGAGATVGSQLVADAAPDGHTLVMSNIASHGVSPSLYRNLRYDAVRDFTHIALITSNPSVFVVNPRTEIQKLSDVVAAARVQRGGLDMASSGSGSSNHLLIMRFGEITGAPVNHVPFRGAGPAMTAVISNQVPLMSDSLPSAASHIRQGSVRAIAMSSEARHPSFPDVPTFREQGIDLVSTSWFGLSGPARMPGPVVERLAQVVGEVLAEPGVRQRLVELGGTPGNLSPAAYAAFVAEEVARWAPVVRSSGATVD